MITKVMTYVPVASLCTSTMCLFLQLKNMSNEVKHSTVQGIHTKNIHDMISHYKMSIDGDLDTIKKNVEVIKSLLELEKEKEEKEKEKEEKEE